jgi:2-polyprenyl-3-methyl-5-hydroxy-6-metoxy-1,4-benzoquinol methylase
MKETKSNWTCVANFMKNHPQINLGRYVSFLAHQEPCRLLHSLAYYKFAAKLIGQNKRVLDVGCNEGLGTWILSKECGFAKGVDFDQQAIETAKINFPYPQVEFANIDILKAKPNPTWDAVINFDVIEHIYPEHTDLFIESIKNQVTNEGLIIIGTPSLISQQFVSQITRKSRVNIYSPEKFEAILRKYFEYVFIFGANDEIVHTSYLPLAHYLIGIGSMKKMISK